MSLMKRLVREKLKSTRKPELVGLDAAIPEMGPGTLYQFAPKEPAPPAPPPKVGGSCRAINADTGRQCALPGGHGGNHVHGRTAFSQVAQPGQTHFARREALDQAATARGFNPLSNPSIQGES